MCSNPFSPKQSGFDRFCSKICKEQYESRKTNILFGWMRENIIKPIRDELHMDVISDTKVRKVGEMATISVIPMGGIRKRRKKDLSGVSTKELEKRIDQYQKASDPLAGIKRLTEKSKVEEGNEDAYYMDK